MDRVFWMQELTEGLTPTEPLNNDIDVDIAIIGGGYVGLWTALQIIEKSPKSKVVVLEKDICGSGASGRNGGFVMSWLQRQLKQSVRSDSSVTQRASMRIFSKMAGYGRLLLKFNWMHGKGVWRAVSVWVIPFFSDCLLKR